MRAFIWFLALWLGVAPAFADSASVAPTANGTAAVGQLPGTTTNDNASAGNVGEYKSIASGATGLFQTTSTVTITIASPGVVTWGTTIPFACATGTAGGVVVTFTTSGALPTGITASTPYYVICSSISGNTFQIATSIDNAVAGTAINTSGSQSGTQTGSPVAGLTSGTVLDIGGFQLTAGDWDVSATIGYSFAATTLVTALTAQVNTVAITQSNLLDGRRLRIATAAQVPNANNIYGVGPVRISTSGNQTIYCGAQAAFTVDVTNALGGCRARRVR